MRPNVLLFGLVALSASLSTHAQSPLLDVVSVKPTPPDAPGLTATREQLGLRLNTTRAPYEVIVVDGVSAPTPD